MNIPTHFRRLRGGAVALERGLAHWSIACSVALVAGCATQPPAEKLNHYVSPVGVPTAKLAIRAQVTGADLYGVTVFGDGDNCKDPQIAGASRQGANAPPSIELSAGRWTTLEFITFHTTNQYCVVRWSFQPTAGRTYLLAGNGAGATCSARLLDATNPDSIKSESTAVRRNAPGNACVPLAVARAARNTTSDAGAGAGREEANLAPNATADDLKGLMTK